jgi:hypothetical protein
MREYRRRKREIRTSAPVSVPSTPSIVRAPEPSSAPERIIDRALQQPARPKAGFIRPGPPIGFKTALELARSFPIGVHGSQVCQYCYNTGYSSPGTRCSYCRKW